MAMVGKASSIRNLAVARAVTSRQQSMKISIIIPALDEAEQIDATLRPILHAKDVEVIVVDGGSRDGTAATAESAGVHVIRTSASRAHQMNAGAAIAHGEILLFLHADARLPADFARLVRDTLSRPKVIAGSFRLRIESARWSLRIIEMLANFRSNWLQMPYGDQALFLRVHSFRTAAGFAKLPILEDFEFVRRLGRWGRIALAPAVVVTSARRWERLGVLRTTLINQAIILAYLLGVQPTRLARWYHREASMDRGRPRGFRRYIQRLLQLRRLWRGRSEFDRAL